MSKIGLTLFPDLTGLAETLDDLRLGHNPILKIQRYDLCMLPNLLIVRLIGSNLKNIPCPCTILDNAHLNANELTDLPNIVSCTKAINLDRNAITHIRSTHAATLKKLKKLIVTGNPLERLEDFLDLENNPSASLTLTETFALDLCKCEHVWLKIAEEMGASITVDDVQCGDDLWSMLNSSQLMERCDQTSLKGT